MTYVEDQCTGISMRSWRTGFISLCVWMSAKSCFRFADEWALIILLDADDGRTEQHTLTQIAHTRPTVSCVASLLVRLALGSAGL